MVKKGPFFDFRKKPKPTPLPHMRLWFVIQSILKNIYGGPFSELWGTLEYGIRFKNEIAN